MALQIDLTDVVTKVIVGLILALLAGFAPMVWSFLRAKTAEIKQEVGESRFGQIEKIVRAGVLAAEQSGLAKDALVTASNKKAWALDFVHQQLEHYGLKVDVEAVDRLVEAAVFDYFNWGKVESQSASTEPK